MIKSTDTTPNSDMAKPGDYPRLLSEVKERIRSAQYEALKAVVEKLAADLRTEFPGVGGFSASNLWQMKAFFEAYTCLEKLASLVREIGWSHNLAIM